MSGVLERMARRALGALPTIQPLMGSRYAPPAVGLRESILEPEVAFEAKPPAAPIEGARPGNRELRADAVQHVESPGVSQMPEAVPQSARGETYVAQVAQDRPRTLTRALTPALSEPAPGAPPEAMIVEQVENSKIVHEPECGGIDVIRAKAFTKRDARMEQEQDFFVEPAGTDAPALMQRDDFRREPPPTPEWNRQPLRALTAVPGEPAEPIEQRTEIHISIGSIELRGARADNRPAAPPFRPRVTLEDFLRRKPDAGA